MNAPLIKENNSAIEIAKYWPTLDGKSAIVKIYTEYIEDHLIEIHQNWNYSKFPALLHEVKYFATSFRSGTKIDSIQIPFPNVDKERKLVQGILISEEFDEEKKGQEPAITVCAQFKLKPYEKNPIDINQDFEFISCHSPASCGYGY